MFLDADDDDEDIVMDDGTTVVQSRAERKRLNLIMEILPERVESVKSSCIRWRYPLIEEYDFRRDKVSPELKIELKSST